MPQAASKPSTGSEKSMRVVGLPATSTSAKFGSASANGPEQQALALHGQEVLAVDPDHVGLPSLARPACLLGAHALDEFGGVAELDVLELDAVARGHLAAPPTAGRR